jgi:cytochrome c oxidase subunit II
MWSNLPLFPENASTIAGKVDLLFLFLVTVAGFFSILIFALVMFFAIRYRRRAANPTATQIHGSTALEMVWTLIPLALTMVMFGWGAVLYLRNARAPAGTLEVYVVAKQWMWKLQHPEGNREINELHVPTGAPIRLIMTSEDVIHSFYVPAFRVKQDVLPGRYTTMWFQPTRAGKYHLFCAEYCGNQHSAMGGWVYVMEPPEYQRWLTGGASGESMASGGQALFDRLGCNGCHKSEGGGRGPSLEGQLGKKIQMADGRVVVADESYVRESILNPRAKIVAGYQPVMPTFQGQVSEEQILQLLAYIKSMKKTERAVAQ